MVHRTPWICIFWSLKLLLVLSIVSVLDSTPLFLSKPRKVISECAGLQESTTHSTAQHSSFSWSVFFNLTYSEVDSVEGDLRIVLFPALCVCNTASWRMDAPALLWPLQENASITEYSLLLGDAVHPRGLMHNFAPRGPSLLVLPSVLWLTFT